MKLVNLVKAGNTAGETTIYISAGDGYFPRFGSYPLPTNGDVYKFADSDRIYVWDGTLLRPSEPETGDIAYGSDGRYAAVYNHGLWWLGSPALESSDNQTYCEECNTGREVHELRIGNVVLDVDPIQFVEDNRELLDAIMTEYLSGKEDTKKDNTLVSIFTHEVTGTAPLKSDRFIAIEDPDLLIRLGASGHIHI